MGNVVLLSETITPSNVVSSTADTIGALLQSALTSLSTLMSNPYIMIFFSFTVLLFGFHIIRSARSMF